MQFELNLASVDTWLKNTESDLAKPVRLDADATVIAMMVNKYEVWIHSVMHVYTHNHLNSPCKSYLIHFCNCFLLYFQL